MHRPCAYCDRPAVNVAYYRNFAEAAGAELTGYPVYLCGTCVAPCSHYADPHASFNGERPLREDELCAPQSFAKY